MENRIEIGAMLDRVVDLYRRNATPVIVAAIFAALVSLLPLILISIVFGFGLMLEGSFDDDTTLQTSAIVALSIGGLVLLLLSWFSTLWLAALCARVTGKDYGRVGEEQFGELARRSLDRLGAMIVATLVASIAIFFGFLALIVPGLILMTIWALVIPVIVFEDVGPMRALGRSYEIVKGNGFNVFVLFFVVFIIVLVVSAVLSFLPVVGSLASGLLTPIPYLISAMVYFRLTDQGQVSAGIAPAGAGIGSESVPEWAPKPGAPDPPPPPQPHIES